MRFDLFYELAVPAFAGRTESQVFEETLEEIALADELGFDTAWVVEHHFMREYSHAGAPDVFLAAAASRTRRIRLGHAIVPLPYHHPVHIAERLATLDILSRGRVEFGFGRGFQPREYAAFGVDMAESRALVEESLAILKRAFAGGPIRHAGRHYRLEDVEVLPRVVQSPHPPLWMAAVSPESFELAAAMGVGVLAGPFKPWFMIERDIERYRAACAAAPDQVKASAERNTRIGMTIGIFCLDDGERARAIAKTNLTWFYRELLKHTAPVLERLYPGYERYAQIKPLQNLLPHAIHLPLLESLGMVVAGDPAHCIERLEKYRAAGVDHLLLAIGAGGSASGLVRESMQTLARHVLPRLGAAA